MASKEIFDKVSFSSSRITTMSYSTSFSMGIRFLSSRFRAPIYNIYGFVRFADEIVDTFHDYDKERLFNSFREDTFRAIEDKISLNPILNSFQKTVHDYGIDSALIRTFLASMEMDLQKKEYTSAAYEQYILGSAEVVGLMCLKVFCEGNTALYEKLLEPAMKLGAAFQKVNFLRDLREDSLQLDRTYFPEMQSGKFNSSTKASIEKNIEPDFRAGYEGILQLPKSSRFGVYLAYIYYRTLFNRIRKEKPENLMNSRIRIPDSQKLFLLLNSYVRHNLNML